MNFSWNFGVFLPFELPFPCQLSSLALQLFSESGIGQNTLFLQKRPELLHGGVRCRDLSPRFISLGEARALKALKEC